MPTIRSILLFPCLFVATALCVDLNAQSGVFLTEEDFYRQSFPEQKPEAKVLWLNKDHKTQAKSILGHDFSRLRVRYQQVEQRTAWVLEEIGKDLPITFGVVVNNNRIETMDVLVFRETRGGEIRHRFFTQQFVGLGLDEQQSTSLDGNVDGITGATLSVRASKKIATLALFFHQLVTMSDKSSSAHQAQR